LVTTHFPQAVSSTRALMHPGGSGELRPVLVTKVSAAAQVNPARQMHGEVHILELSHTRT